MLDRYKWCAINVEIASVTCWWGLTEKRISR